MTNFSNIKKSDFKDKLKHPNNKNKSFLSKLSQSFLLPIAILPFAGILLAIGGAIGSNFESQGAQDFANFIKGMSDVIFANLGVLFAISISIYFTYKNKIYSGFMVIIGYLCFSGVQSAFIHFSPNGSFQNIFYFHTDSNLQYLVTKSLGITSLQTSVFGGIIIGLIVAFIMNRWSDIELPVSLNFFSGVKFVPMILIPVSAFLAILTLIVWPFLGIAIVWLGNVANKAPAGLDVFVFGAAIKALIPFGLHHILNGLVLQSSLGGTITTNLITDAGTSLGILDSNDFQEVVKAISSEKWNNSVVGDLNTWNFINSLPVNRLPINSSGDNVLIFDWFTDYVGVYSGRFLQDYPAYLGVEIGIGFALMFAAKPKNRKKTIGLIGTSTLVCFTTSIVEPLDFSFLFVAPVLYYAVAVPFSGLAFLLMKISGAHVGGTITRGFFDLIFFGIIPVNKGTRFWFVFPYSALEGILCFLIFYFSIKIFDLKTPGREDVFSERKKVVISDETVKKYLIAYGGISNLASVSACASRLRVEVIDASMVNEEEIQKLGSQGFIKKGNSSQNILGGAADILSGKINDLLLSEIE